MAYFPSIGLWRPSLAGRAPPLRCKIALCHLRRELKPLRETPRRSCKWRSEVTQKMVQFFPRSEVQISGSRGHMKLRDCGATRFHTSRLLAASSAPLSHQVADWTPAVLVRGG